METIIINGACVGVMPRGHGRWSQAAWWDGEKTVTGIYDHETGRLEFLGYGVEWVEEAERVCRERNCSQ
jgi:hypothetical protein